MQLKVEIQGTNFSIINSVEFFAAVPFPGFPFAISFLGVATCELSNTGKKERTKNLESQSKNPQQQLQIK